MSSKKGDLDDLYDILNLRDVDESHDFDKMILHFKFIDIVRDLMGNMKKKELAEKLGKSPAHISKLFNGDNKINLSFLAEIERVFEGAFEPTFKKHKELSYPELDNITLRVAHSRQPFKGTANIESKIETFDSDKTNIPPFDVSYG